VLGDEPLEPRLTLAARVEEGVVGRGVGCALVAKGSCQRATMTATKATAQRPKKAPTVRSPKVEMLQPSATRATTAPMQPMPDDDRGGVRACPQAGHARLCRCPRGYQLCPQRGQLFSRDRRDHAENKPLHDIRHSVADPDVVEYERGRSHAFIQSRACAGSVGWRSSATP
jgi:hypothetical protein